MATNIVRHDYNGVWVPQRGDGLVNLTAMASAGGKLVADYLRLKGTKAYIEELSRVMGIPITELLVIKQGGDDQGTWGHVEIAVDLAQWVSVPFRIWANKTLRAEIQKASEPGIVAAIAPLSAEQSINLLSNAFTQFNLNSSPRHLQLVQDRIANLLAENNTAIAPSGESLAIAPAKWYGVAEIAEQLGFKPYDVSKHRAPLGRIVAAWYRDNEGKEPQTEQRIVNGRTCDLKVYQRTDDLDTTISLYLETKGLEAA